MARSKRTARANRFLWTILRVSVGKAVLLFTSVQVKNRKLLNHAPAPFMVLGNHVNNWDPVVLGALSRRPISFVASDAFFRGGFMEKLFNRLGVIPKTKFRSDLDTVKRIFQIRDRGGIIGIYPEGRRTYNGATMPVLESTAKLIKTVKIPVLISLTRGGYLYAPRWGRGRRRGPKVVEIKEGVSREEIKSLSVEDLIIRLEQLLFNDDYANQLAEPQRYRSGKPAEYLETILTLCPECGSVGKFVSRKDRLTCGGCGRETTLADSGLFTVPGVFGGFRHPGEWDRWQTEEYRRRYEALKDGDVLFSDPGTLLFRFDGKNFIPVYNGTAELRNGAVYLDTGESDPLVFPFETIDGANIQSSGDFEFYGGDDLFRLVFPSPRISAYKWLTILRIAGKL